MGDAPTGPDDTERTRTLWFALLLTLTNGFMDAHTFYVRGGVFANVQTGNVIFFAIDLSERKLAAAMAHVWPILAFVVGIWLASHIKSGRADRIVTHPLRWAIAVQVIVLGAIGFVPVSVAHSYVTVPIAFLAAVQMGLFRNIGDVLQRRDLGDPLEQAPPLCRAGWCWRRRARAGRWRGAGRTSHRAA